MQTAAEHGIANKVSTSMAFVPALRPPSGGNRSQCWFLIRGDRILIDGVGTEECRPYFTDVSFFGPTLKQKQYLGHLNGNDCYAAELDDAAPLPSRAAWQRVRALLGVLEDELLGIAGRANQLVYWSRTHRFCGRCGRRTRDKTDERAKICPTCGLINYPRVSPAIIVAILNGPCILLARSTRVGSSFYSVLAGFVEPGESLEECARREIFEEVGLKVDRIRYFGSQPWPFPNTLMVGFTAHYAGGDIKVNPDEIVDAQWFPAEGLPPVPGRWSIARRLIDWFVAESGHGVRRD